MPRKNFVSIVITASLAIALFTTTTSFKKRPAVPGGPVTITAVYDFSTFPDVFGHFTTSGALNISGTSEMIIGPNSNGVRAHCIVYLTTSQGTITIHQECEFASPTPRGSWQIISGTGAFGNLKGNGSLTMPPDTEAMEGTLH